MVFQLSPEQMAHATPADLSQVRRMISDQHGISIERGRLDDQEADLARQWQQLLARIRQRAKRQRDARA